ncbi:MAG TPA: hypothetical protein VLL72_00985 [Kiloniellales bacterium]|nr:hypothetical protein [Kiloniellales bacterium]
MGFRRVLEELEARLEPMVGAENGGTGRGKLEFKRYGDGRLRMKIKCRELDLPDGAKLELRSGETLVARLEARKGRATLDEERDASEGAPPLAAGDLVTLCYQGVPLLGGRLYID